MRSWWTVFAVTVDTKEGYVAHVHEPDVAAAKAKVYRDASDVILIAGVVEGKITEAKEPDSDVTPLRGRGHAIIVNHVQATLRKVVIPSRCPACKADLRQPRAITQIDFATRSWDGHLTKTGDSVSAERDHAASMRTSTALSAVRVRCTNCKHSLWDGLHAESRV